MNERTRELKSIILNFLVPIVCVVVSLLMFIFVIYPAFHGLPALQAKITETTALRDQLNAKQIKLHRFVDYKDVLNENSGLVNQVVPADQNVPGLLDQLNQIADESGMDVTKLSYSVSDVNSNEDAANNYSAVLVSLGADGTYDQMLSFMKSAENASRIVNISNFRFNAVSVTSGEKLSFTFILSAPYLNVQSSAVTDDPIALDITSGDFVTFVNKVKALRYFEKSGDLSKISIPVTQVKNVDQASETSQSTPSKP